MKTLFDSYQLGALRLANRIAMAPMTRSRAPSSVADEQTATYYRQRASAGLLITEGTPISQEGTGFVFIPGIWSDEQVRGWRRVTDAVHQENGKIYAQIWHVGRMSHTSLQSGGRQPVSATGTPARDRASLAFIVAEDGTPGFTQTSVPRPLETAEVGRVVQDFARAADNARIAGFDGVEIHGANGYLIEQFLNPRVNDRTDRYAADTLENRTRFVLEVVDAVIARIGKERTGIRLSPFGTLFDMPEHLQTEETYLHLGRELSARGIAYVHLADQWNDGVQKISDEFLRKFRDAFSGTIILAGSLDKSRAERLVRNDLVDLVAFGQPFIANPDLVNRIRRTLPLAKPDRSTYYGGNAVGYTDYPSFGAQQEAEVAESH
ncbi:alkene reductase [Variovorax sp. J31P216]|nr:alkene reductase [Variovorax sp. J31P216]MDM0030102.1 alkene reductase [Variovorax sp. J31P216]